MDAAFHERDTHVTAKCNVCFKGVNAAGGAAEIRHTAIGGIANARRRRRKALRGRKGASARGKRRATEPRGQGQTAAAKQNGKHQTPSGKRQTTINRTGRLAANGRRRAARNATRGRRQATSMRNDAALLRIVHCAQTKPSWQKMAQWGPSAGSIIQEKASGSRQGIRFA